MMDTSQGGYSSTSDGLKSHFSSDESDVDPKTKQLSWFTWSKDTKKVMFWMLVVLGMIGVTAAIVLSFTFTFLSTEEENEFKNGFLQQSNVIAEATRFHAKTVVGSLEAMSDTITSFTGATAASFPFVSIPDFQRRGQRARVEAYLEMIAFSPLVTYEDRHRWSIYSSYDSDWLGDSTVVSTSIPKDIYRLEDGEDGQPEQPVVEDNILMVPVWMTSPKPHNASLINFNILSDSLYYFLFNAMTESKHTALSAVYKSKHVYDHLFEDGEHAFLNDNPSNQPQSDSSSSSTDEYDPIDVTGATSVSAEEFPHSVLMAPVYDSFNISQRSLAGVIHGVLPWDSYLTELLPPGVNGIYTVLKNSCGQSFTFRIDGPKAKFIGEGDLTSRSKRYDDMAREVDFGSSFLGEETRTYRQCFYSLVVYPSKEFEETYHQSNETEKFTALLAVVFSLLALVFFIFVWFVQRRQQKVMGVAVRTSAIISGLFPDNVRERIMKSAEQQANREMDGGGADDGSSNLRTILQDTTPAPFEGRMSTGSAIMANLRKSAPGGPVPGGITVLEDAPIADLYAATTVLFADIVGFTAWSSTRDPAQVFVLLETLYGAFDAIAKRRRVFKVETIGDCYVAVAGLPQPRRDHALAMARFAHDCLMKSSAVFHALEVTLGPGTSSLNLRLGLHSGPVTAGVLRGEKGRFQLFGDTVNTAARMESNSRPGKIHCSKDTADLILAAGKTNWVSERPDKIHAKGKGEMTTYFLNVSLRGNEGESTTSGDSSESLLPAMDPFALPGGSSHLTCGSLPNNVLNTAKKTLPIKQARLVDWNAELLTSLLKSIVSGRRSHRRATLRGSSEPRLDVENDPKITMPFDEWAQAIALPDKTSSRSKPDKPVELSEAVVSQLKQFVATIACLHGDNPFHNFEHASHVCMSVHKLLIRVIQSGEDSFGIASDPLTHFAAVLSALIHDVDHRGVPNSQLVAEEPALAVKYENKSVAEQHAIDLAWKVLMGEEYSDLRKTIYTTEGELKRFRTVLVNSVLSTDIVNKDLKNLRNERWNLAFAKEQTVEDADQYRASSVLEHLIQASDVSHTMQHWHVYRTWNERLFEEMYRAYQDGRAEQDPSLTWYKGEMGFFDFYIIPLAKKLAEVGVFGVSSSEYLDFALKNRAEWEVKGKAVVQEMLVKVRGCQGIQSVVVQTELEC